MDIKPLKAEVDYNTGLTNIGVDAGIYITSNGGSDTLNLLAYDCYEDIVPRTIGGVSRLTIRKDLYPSLSNYDVVIDGALLYDPFGGYVYGGDSTYGYVSELPTTYNYNFYGYVGDNGTRYNYYHFDKSQTGYDRGSIRQLYNCTGYIYADKGNHATTPRYYSLYIKLPEFIPQQTEMRFININADMEIDANSLEIGDDDSPIESRGSNIIIADGTEGGSGYQATDQEADYYAKGSICCSDGPGPNDYEKQVKGYGQTGFYGYGANNIIMHNNNFLKHPDEMTRNNNTIYTAPARTKGGITFANIAPPSGTGRNSAKGVQLGTISSAGVGQYKICSCSSTSTTGSIPSSFTSLPKNYYSRYYCSTSSCYIVYVDNTNHGVVLQYPDSASAEIPLKTH